MWIGIKRCAPYLWALPRKNPLKFIAKKNNKMDNARTAYLLLPSASNVGPNMLKWDWLGNGNQSNSEKTFLEYEDAENLLHQLGIMSETKWRDFCMSGQRPENIPANPNNVYKDSRWVSWPKWLGTWHKERFKDFEMTRTYSRSLGLGSSTDWREFRESGKRPTDIPSQPSHYCANKS